MIERIRLNEYEVVYESGGVFEVTRNGEPWRNLTGDNLVLSMFMKIQELISERDNLKEQIATMKVQMKEMVDMWKDGKIPPSMRLCLEMAAGEVLEKYKKAKEKGT